MAYEVQPLPFKPHRLEGLSDRLLVSHYENNYGGAVRRLNAIEGRLSGLDFGAAAVFDLNGLGRERLIAANSMLSHEVYFEALGGSGEPANGLARALERDFGSVDRWRNEFTAMGKALAGGSGWVLLTWSERLSKLTNQWAADHCHTLADAAPILALDMYEHAYAIDFGAKAGAYVDAFMRNIHWDRMEARYGRALDPAVPRTAWPQPGVPKVTAAELRARQAQGEDITLVDVCLEDDLPGAPTCCPEPGSLHPNALTSGRTTFLATGLSWRIASTGSRSAARRSLR